jgi:hypothetical protein
MARLRQGAFASRARLERTGRVEAAQRLESGRGAAVLPATDPQPAGCGDSG